MILKLPTSIALFVLLTTAFAASAASQQMAQQTAQQKRQTPVRTQPQPAPTPVPTPPPTFDTLLAADSYRIYGEVRSVGQFIKSNSVTEILEPIMKLAGPPKEFRTIVKWLNTHADEVISSRLLFAGWSSSKDMPDALVAIEFATPEDAAKFQQHLNGFLDKVLPPQSAAVTVEGEKAQAGDQSKPAPPKPQYHMQQAGSLILITPAPFNLKKLRPAGTKLLSEDVNFRIARNRFTSESLFVFIDVDAMEKEEAERIKKYEEEYQKAQAERAANPDPPKVELVTDPEEEEPPVPPPTIVGVETQLGSAPSNEKPPPEPPAQAFLMALSMVMSGVSSVEAKWPAAVGVALSLDGESFDVRALMINAPGEKSDAIPLFPLLATGPPITPEASNILPADTEMLVSLSLDLPQMYAMLSKPQPMFSDMRRPHTRPEPIGDIESPVAALERQLKIKIKDDLLPLIGSEVVVSVPMKAGEWFQPPKSEPRATSQPSPSPSPEPSPDADVSGDSFKLTETTRDPLKENSVVIAISLKDKEGMKALLPKLIESVAFKGASSLAQTERREDTELVSYVNMFSYAFIGNFLVLSPDVKTTRYVVDSYLKHQTLSSDPHFKNYTRWHPRQLQGQIYISPSLMESYRTWAQQPTAQIDEQTRAFLTRFSLVAQPVTYSLSNEGFGPLHELHVPKNLVLLLIAATAGAVNTPPPADMPSNPTTTPPTSPN
jgi:Protein of unknown function (DUF3352)